ncbi:MAG: hypothetical protein U0514_01170 [Candidatus Andersenbacteria bacterium]
MPTAHRYQVITIFPEIIDGYAQASILGRGQAAGAIKVEAVNLRDFAEGVHKTVDDTPYGGGPGMVLKPEPIFRAVEHLGRREPWVSQTARDPHGPARRAVHAGDRPGVEQAAAPHLYLRPLRRRR